LHYQFFCKRNRGNYFGIKFALGATALGVNGSKQIGGVTGLFTGTISRAGDTYTAIGSFVPFANTYNFDLTKPNSFHNIARDAANITGTTGELFPD
jgi:hypothetical protein